MDCADYLDRVLQIFKEEQCSVAYETARVYLLTSPSIPWNAVVSVPQSTWNHVKKELCSPSEQVFTAAGCSRPLDKTNEGVLG